MISFIIAQNGGAANLVNLRQQRSGFRSGCLDRIFNLLQSRLSIRMLFLHNGQFFFLCAQNLGKTFHALQPEPDLQLFFFVCQFQKALCFFCLNTKRTHTAFQLLQNILQPQQVILRLLQAAFRLIFTVTELGNSGGLFKYLPPVLRTGGNNVCNFPLADDGIAVAPKTGVHEQLMDVTKTHRSAVDQIIAFAGTVVAACDAHLIAVIRQSAVRIINTE